MVPVNDAMLGEVRFEDWLPRSANQNGGHVLFQFEQLRELARAIESSEEATARHLLRLYEVGDLRASAHDIASLKEVITRDLKTANCIKCKVAIQPGHTHCGGCVRLERDQPRKSGHYALGRRA
jgi:hypothetical protein